MRLSSVSSAHTGGGVDPICAEELVTSARYVSGNFAELDAGLLGRVERLVDWLNRQPMPGHERRAEVALQLRKLLATRLRLSADRARLPAIADQAIDRPIFVIGFARTGTTLLHSLLAEDPGLRAPMWWHTHEPSPPPGETPVVEARIEFAAQDLDRLLHIAPGLLTLHPYWDKRGRCLIEDEEIFTLDFQNAYPSLLYRAPSLGLSLDADDAPGAYAFHRQFLQHLQWNCEPKRWALKGIYHQFALDALFEAYPDALCVWPHRDPLDVHPSTLAITSVLYGGISDWTMDFKALGPAFVDNIRKSLDATLDNPLVDDPRIFHVGFKQVAQDPIGTIQRAYAHWGLHSGAEHEARMRTWLTDPSNRSDRYGRYAYALEPFGLSAEMLRNAFSGYRKRFDLA